MTEGSSRSGKPPGPRYRRRWTRVFWIVEVIAIAAIPVILLLLQFSQEGYMRRNGVRVTATVAGEGSADGCVRCRLLFTLDGELHGVEKTLVAGGSKSERRYYPGEVVELYVDPNDTSYVYEVAAIEENIFLGGLGIAVAAVIAIAWPVYERMRPTPPALSDGPD